VFNGFTVAGRYAVNLERAPGQYDFLPEGEDYLEDLNRLDLSASKTWGKYNLTFKLNNALDDVVEVLPGYDNRGREVLITLQYNW
jgi:outer membrane cobalamin receptor